MNFVLWKYNEIRAVEIIIINIITLVRDYLNIMIWNNYFDAVKMFKTSL